ncbi:UNVERIFIED_CONTAM: hypothetical protein FKN15_040561 [Acipenser sinensis]
MAAVFMATNMAGKARASNFTLSEKLDLLKLVKPHIRILEEHTNKHAVIVDKNKCWDSIAEQYNTLGGDRPPRTAQGLRTLYKRLKESAKQEMVQRKHAQPEYRGSISEPTKRVMEMIPHLFRPIHDKDHNALPRMIYKHDSSIEQPGSSSSLPTISDYKPASVTVRLDQEIDVKPPPELTILSTRIEGDQEEDEDVVSVHGLDGSISPCPSSINLAVTMSPSPIPMKRDIYSRAENFRHLTGIEHETLQLSKAEHELVMDNHRKMGLYIEEKREGLKRKQQLEEELLKDALVMPRPSMNHQWMFNKKKEKSPKSRPDEVCESALYEGLTNLFPEGCRADGYKTEDSGKLQVLADLLAAIRQLSPAERVVCVSNYTQTVDMLQEMCKGFGYSYTWLDGQNSVSQRQQIAEGFNSRYSLDFVLMSLKAGGVGLNLVGGITSDSVGH